MAGYIGKSQGVTQVDGYTQSEADNKFVEGDDTLYVDETNNRVGIGTSSITSGVKMQVQSTGGTVLSIKDTTSGSGDYSNIWFGDEDSEYPGYLGYNHGSDAMTFGTSATERMRIDSSGNLLVGSTGSVYSTGSKVEILYRGATQFGSNWKTETSDGVPHNFVNSSGTRVGYIYCTASATSYNTSSDYRLKENVVDLTGAIARVKSLQPKRFNFIADSTDTVVDGFLAHEAQAVVPEAVQGTHDAVDDEGNPVYQGIDQSKLVPLLTAALQEAITKIETLETEMTSVKSRLDALEAS